MHMLARFVTRPSEIPGQPDLMLGFFGKYNHFFMPNTVYEISDCMGVPTIIDRRKSWLTQKDWYKDINQLIDIHGKHLIISAQEKGTL